MVQEYRLQEWLEICKDETRKASRVQPGYINTKDLVFSMETITWYK